MLLIGSLVLFECAARCRSQLNESVSPRWSFHTPSLTLSSCLRLKPKTHWFNLMSVKTPASINIDVLTLAGEKKHIWPHRNAAPHTTALFLTWLAMAVKVLLFVFSFWLVFSWKTSGFVHLSCLAHWSATGTVCWPERYFILNHYVTSK